MSSLDFIRGELNRLGGSQFKAIQAATGVKTWTLWRLANSRTLNPRHETVERLRKYLEEAR